jgi:hypothetical protein
MSVSETTTVAGVQSPAYSEFTLFQSLFPLMFVIMLLSILVSLSKAFSTNERTSSLI